MPNDIRRKLFDAPEVKLADNDDATGGEITGYASTFANFDDVGERVVKGAFTRHLRDFLKDGFIAVGHNWSTLPIAMPLDATEDDHGLFVRGMFHSTGEAQNARTVMRERLAAGKSVKLSIGYEVLADEFTEEGRLLKDVRLFEWSYVTVPANSMAAVTGVKWIPPGGGSLHDFADAVSAALPPLRAFVAEVQSLEGRRAKAGRVLSAANIKLVDSTIATGEELLVMLRELRARGTSDGDDEKAKAEAERLLAEFQRTSLTLNRILHT